jgi:hypothetical protein
MTLDNRERSGSDGLSAIRCRVNRLYTTGKKQENFDESLADGRAAPHAACA